MRNAGFRIILLLVTVYFVPSNAVPPKISTRPQYEILASWKSLDFKFPTPKTRIKFLQTGQFIPENNVVAGIKVHGPRVYVTVPRLRPGVPSTLNYINLDNLSRSLDKSPLLRPYPSWNMQRVGNCNALQFVQSMEIDRWGRMWIIDVGRENILSEVPNYTTPSCPAKLVIVDLTTNQIIHKHEFPVTVVNPHTNFLNDIVVECKSDKWRCWAYMTDSRDAKMVLYSLEEDRSSFVKHHMSMTANPQATQFNILGTAYNFTFNLNGIALSPRTTTDHDRVFYTPLSSYSIYSVSTSTLKEALTTGKTFLQNHEISLNVNHRRSQSGGIMMDAKGLLFTGQLQNNAVSYFNITSGLRNSNSLLKPETLLIKDDVELQWPDTFAFDNHGYLYLVTCRMHRYFSNTLNFEDVNFRVIRVFVGSKSYMY